MSVIQFETISAQYLVKEVLLVVFPVNSAPWNWIRIVIWDHRINFISYMALFSSCALFLPKFFQFM